MAQEESSRDGRKIIRFSSADGLYTESFKAQYFKFGDATVPISSYFSLTDEKKIAALGKACDWVYNDPASKELVITRLEENEKELRELRQKQANKLAGIIESMYEEHEVGTKKANAEKLKKFEEAAERKRQEEEKGKLDAVNEQQRKMMEQFYSMASSMGLIANGNVNGPVGFPSTVSQMPPQFYPQVPPPQYYQQMNPYPQMMRQPMPTGTESSVTSGSPMGIVDNNNNQGKSS